MSLPLEGIRVLDLGISTAGPYAARFLADLGAEVIKVEPLAGENSRSLGLRYGDAGYLFHVNNYNKRSVALRVQDAAGRKIFLELVAGADVVIENFASGTMDGWGIGYEACRQANPSIVYCSAKGFGDSGELRTKRAFDTVVQGLTGIMDATGEPGDPPLKGGPSVCDLLTAGAAVMATMSAIVSRVPGESVFLDTALYDIGVWSMAWLWPAVAARESDAASRIGSGHPAEAPFGTFACADGDLFVAVDDAEAWRALAPLLDCDSAWDAAARKRNEPRIGARLQAWLHGRPRWEAAGELQSLGVPATPVLGLDEVAGQPIMRERELVTEVAHPAFGHVPLLRSPLAVAGATRPPIRALQPLLGADTEDVLATLGEGEHDLASLRLARVVAP